MEKILFLVRNCFPNWFMAIIAGYFAGKAIIYHAKSSDLQQKHEKFLIVKGVVLLLAALISLQFTFIAVDAILTYVIYCGFIANNYVQKGINELKYMVYGVLVCIPSIFIFFFKVNPHRWLNKDDLSHLLMLACIFFFYLGAKKSAGNIQNFSIVDKVKA
ncbi:MAG: hypothetical protein HYR91_10830 [Flavobacteriia bacterium]|nr:hypothetical protein [Flavobacteriia bacterium]